MTALIGLGLMPSRADSGQLSPERLDLVDRAGYFTPGFKAAVHDLVNAKQSLQQAQAQTTQLTLELPALQRQAKEADAKTAALREELARYDHPEETDFTALQQEMNNPASSVEERMDLAQAYLWAYPASPHASEAKQDLQEMQKRMADEQQALKDAAALRAAAHAKLVQRAQARELSLVEWRGFLQDMSQDDLLKYLGKPTSQTGDYWIYSGNWITDPATHLKVGLVINFNGGRVISVSEPPHDE